MELKLLEKVVQNNQLLVQSDSESETVFSWEQEQLILLKSNSLLPDLFSFYLKYCLAYDWCS